MIGVASYPVTGSMVGSGCDIVGRFCSVIFDVCGNELDTCEGLSTFLTLRLCIDPLSFGVLREILFDVQSGSSFAVILSCLLSDRELVPCLVEPSITPIDPKSAVLPTLPTLDCLGGTG